MQNDIEKTADNLVRSEVLLNVSHLVSELAQLDEYMDELMDVCVQYREKYAADQYRYIVDLDERGMYRASVYSIDEETGEDSREPVFSIDESMFAEGGDFEIYNTDDPEGIVDELLCKAGREYSSYVLGPSDDPVTEECDEPDEALEHWVVTDRLADDLEEQGEMIVRDFLGLTIWGRTTSGQAISSDGVMHDVARALKDRVAAMAV